MIFSLSSCVILVVDNEDSSSEKPIHTPVQYDYDTIGRYVDVEGNVQYGGDTQQYWNRHFTMSTFDWKGDYCYFRLRYPDGLCDIHEIGFEQVFTMSDFAYSAKIYYLHNTKLMLYSDDLFTDILHINDADDEYLYYVIESADHREMKFSYKISLRKNHNLDQFDFCTICTEFCGHHNCYDEWISISLNESNEYRYVTVLESYSTFESFYVEEDSYDPQYVHETKVYHGRKLVEPDENGYYYNEPNRYFLVRVMSDHVTCNLRIRLVSNRFY